MKWNWTDWSNLTWIALTLMIVAVELLGYWRVGPWRTLSETIWFDEKRFHPLYLLIGGFLCGLGLHFSPARLHFWWAQLAGLVIVSIAYGVALAFPQHWPT